MPRTVLLRFTASDHSASVRLKTMIKNHLIIFARFPKLGTGKRRLAREIGPVRALWFQRMMLHLLVRRLSKDPRWVTWIAATPDGSRPWPKGVRVIPQGEGDLGRRMARAARLRSPGSVVIIGSDIPGITANIIAHAFRELGRRDAVFGPAGDGGYWLVGLRRRPRFIDPFQNILWSTSTVLHDTLVRLKNSDVALLDVLEDVDDLASLGRHHDWYRQFPRRIGVGSAARPADPTIGTSGYRPLSSSSVL